ncbi:MAG: penicillin-binding protein activator LpoB [Candidatus Cloacimonetes bacterium]|nr:penicillin-binding protein activator LpoB [Candidatus Cloacimonadota bacterium]MDD3578144.1 penicillin-binding protein activator LpoB [Candidatus Cloacimonadota bacterium]MDY0337126.1 penicillin-binding protein activator LpoB [Candidatus Cloacimonadaceae bacterium]
MMKQVVIIVLLGMLLLLTACGPSVKVQRVSSDTATDFGGRWNDTDSRLVSEEMVRDMLSRPWMSRFSQTEGRSPVLIIGTMRNLSSEHIEMQTFATDIARELLNSGLVRFIASREERDEVREERSDQQYHASEESAKRMANEVGADYMLQGVVKSITDRVDNTQAKFYQVDLQLVDVESSETVWIGSKEIKKLVERSRLRL